MFSMDKYEDDPSNQRLAADGNNTKVKLISSDDVEFYVDFELIKHSKTLEVFLDTKYPFIQSQTKEIKLPIKSKYLKRILEFMRYSNERKIDRGSSEFKIEDEETMDLLEIASYLRI